MSQSKKNTLYIINTVTVYFIDTVYIIMLIGVVSAAHFIFRMVEYVRQNHIVA